MVEKKRGLVFYVEFNFVGSQGQLQLPDISVEFGVPFWKTNWHLAS